MAETTRNLLLEIGTEEIPARFCQPALDQLKANTEKALTEARLDFGRVETLGTPRRLVLYVRDLALTQRDREVVQKGPSRKAAFAPDGTPTMAARKFAESQGVSVEDLELMQDKKGEYVYVRRLEKGQSVAQVLPDLLVQLVLSIDWPKSMRWGDRSIRYARPIRWILALLGNSRVPFAVDGIESGNTTQGHRTLGAPQPVAVPDADEYFYVLGQNYVIVDQEHRKRLIWQQVSAEAERAGGFVQRDEDLLEEVTWLVEHPLAFRGAFSESYLDVPPQVLVTTMKENQRYFPVYKDEQCQELLPYFIAVRNGTDDNLDVVRAGNEKVLAARLADARFFWDEDRKLTLAEHNEKLKEVVFQERLGTQWERVQRLVTLTARVAAALELPLNEHQQAVEAARLCKADLTTKMVFEFPEVQGYMGQQYLLRQGGDPAVAKAIYEHYLPRGAGDELPRTGPGIAVALADKLDTLAGYFSIGLVPTGSQDPFALRRAALGVLQTVVENQLSVDVTALASEALAQFDLGGADGQKVLTSLMDFFQTRLKVLMEGRGLRYDVIDAVIAAGMRRPYDAVRRAEALAAMLGDESFAAVTGAFKRIANLAGKVHEAGVEPGEVDPMLFAEPAERELYGAFVDLRPDMKHALEAGQYEAFFRTAARLKEPVDAFLDTVRVNSDDLALRANRYSLLVALANLLSAPADLSRLAG